MKIALLRTSAAIAVVFSCGLMASADAEQPAATGQTPVEQAGDTPQEIRATVVTPVGRHQQSVGVERQQVTVAGGEMVTVLRPVMPAGEEASDQEQDVQRERPLAWQVAAGGRLWLVDPASGDLRTCAVRQTSTVGVQELRCLSVRGARL